LMAIPMLYGPFVCFQELPEQSSARAMHMVDLIEYFWQLVLLMELSKSGLSVLHRS